MSKPAEHGPHSVYALADSLDSILAACEDLLTLDADANRMFRSELAAITHVMQARRHAEDLDVSDLRLHDHCALFLAGTAELAGDRLRNNASCLEPSTIPASDNHKIAGRVPLGALAELAGALLDALEEHFVLYEEQPPPASGALLGPTRSSKPSCYLSNDVEPLDQLRKFDPQLPARAGIDRVINPLVCLAIMGREQRRLRDRFWPRQQKTKSE
jgi:hypothetical protein